VFAVALVR